MNGRAGEPRGGCFAGPWGESAVHTVLRELRVMANVGRPLLARIRQLTR